MVQCADPVSPEGTGDAAQQAPPSPGYSRDAALEAVEQGASARVGLRDATASQLLLSADHQIKLRDLESDDLAEEDMLQIYRVMTQQASEIEVRRPCACGLVRPAR